VSCVHSVTVSLFVHTLTPSNKAVLQVHYWDMPKPETTEREDCHCHWSKHRWGLLSFLCYWTKQELYYWRSSFWNCKLGQQITVTTKEHKLMET